MAEAIDDQARRLERGLLRVRWFAAVLGLYLVSQTNSGPPPRASHRVLVLAYGVVGILAVTNLAFELSLRAVHTGRGLRRLGIVAFAVDAAVVFSLAWIYTYDPRGSTWVVVYIIPLEGALRYQLKGSLGSVAMTLANEFGREAFLAHRFPHAGIYAGTFEHRYEFLVANVAFRVGIQAIIALVAGFMARSLAREAELSAEQAVRFEEVARRESAARRELAAFNTAILTGVAAEDLDSSMLLMAAAIGPDLEFESLTILLRDGADLVVKGMYGIPFYRHRIPIGTGVTGTVAATGQPLIVPDVREFPGYVEGDPDMRSEMAAPMRIGDELIGVLDVEGRTAGQFDEQHLRLLSRLADQLALVAHSNRLLSQQRETMRRLQELDEMKSDFVAITSHELRTPITAIRGFVKTLMRNRDRLSEEELTRFLGIIDRQSARLAGLVEDLLFVSRIEAGTVRFSPHEVDLPGFLRDAVDSLDPESRSRIDLRVRGNAGTIVIDPHRVDQILENLIENGLKFSPPETSVVIEGSVEGDWVELSVTDRGVGISTEDLPRIFDRFHQAGHAMTREVEGAGLGLYITKRLVDAMGGSITVTSTPGGGSTFRVSLPKHGPRREPEPGILVSSRAETTSSGMNSGPTRAADTSTGAYPLDNA